MQSLSVSKIISCNYVHNSHRNVANLVWICYGMAHFRKERTKKKLKTPKGASTVEGLLRGVW